MSEWSGTLYGLGLCGRSLPESATGNEGQEHLTSLVPAPQVNEVAPQGVAGVSGSTEGRAEGIASRSPRLCNAESATFEGGVPPTGVASAKKTPNSQSIGLKPLSTRGSEYQASPADSPILDRHGDDRFADNILRACRNLPQNGDDEEERDAAEEGALIEASGMPDPARDPRWA